MGRSEHVREGEVRKMGKRVEGKGEKRDIDGQERGRMRDKGRGYCTKKKKKR